MSRRPKAQLGLKKPWIGGPFRRGLLWEGKPSDSACVGLAGWKKLVRVISGSTSRGLCDINDVADGCKTIMISVHKLPWFLHPHCVFLGAPQPTLPPKKSHSFFFILGIQLKFLSIFTLFLYFTLAIVKKRKTNYLSICATTYIKHMHVCIK